MFFVSIYEKSTTNIFLLYIDEVKSLKHFSVNRTPERENGWGTNSVARSSVPKARHGDEKKRGGGGQRLLNRDKKNKVNPIKTEPVYNGISVFNVKISLSYHKNTVQ